MASLVVLAAVSAAGATFTTLKNRLAPVAGFYGFRFHFTADHYQTAPGTDLDLAPYDALLLFDSVDENNGTFKARWFVGSSTASTAVSGHFAAVGVATSYAITFDVPQSRRGPNNAVLIGNERFTGAVYLPPSSSNSRVFIAGTGTSSAGSLTTGIRPFCGYLGNPQPAVRPHG
jgi:hypothetical protein